MARKFTKISDEVTSHKTAGNPVIDEKNQRGSNQPIKERWMSREALLTTQSIGTIGGKVFFDRVAWNLACLKQLFPLPAGHACECICLPGGEDTPATGGKGRFALHF